MNTVIQSLRQATEHLHHKVEQYAHAAEIRQNTFSLALYKDLIAKNYRIHAQLEALLLQAKAQLGHTPLYQFHTSKLPLLAKDAQLLQIPLPVPKQHFEAIPLETTGHLVGLLYVLEGSMLGGQFIYKALKKNEQLAHLPEFYFFAGNGSDTGQQWRTFCTLAERSDIQQEEAHHAAKLTFQFYCEVYAQVEA